MKNKKVKNPGSKTSRPFTQTEVTRLIHLLQARNHGTDWIRKRDIVLVIFGVNTGLRVADLVNLSVGQVLDLQPGEDLDIIETKKKKKHTMTMTPSMRAILEDYLSVAYPGILRPDRMDKTFTIGVRKVFDLSYQDVLDQPLFRSRKGAALQSESVGDMIQDWGRELGFAGQLGAHTFRKSFGAIHYNDHGTSLAVLCDALNHDDPKTTREYLGITGRHVKECRLQEIGII